MGRCAYCEKFIIGGKKQGSVRFCSDTCYEQGFLAQLADQATPELIVERIQEIRARCCPVCEGEGPLDLYTTHTAWSLIVFTGWRHRPQLSCAGCGRKSIQRGLASTALLGWWSIPLGIVMTPWQLINGFKELSKCRDTSEPSTDLLDQVRLELGAEIVAKQSAEKKRVGKLQPVAGFATNLRKSAHAITTEMD